MPEPVLRKAPLTTVVCELRFQPVGAELHAIELAKGLEEIGLTAYAREEGLQVQMGPGQLNQQPIERHRFTTPDGASTLTLDRGVFAYQTAAYRGIDDFLDTWERIAAAAAEVLDLQARARIGLRYVNEIKLRGPDRQEVEPAVNADLLPPWGAAQPDLEDLFVSMHELRFNQDGGELAFRHGLQRQPGSAPVYLLDFDHYEQRLSGFDVEAEAELLRAFNARVYEIFRWSITEESYEAFEPEERSDV